MKTINRQGARLLVAACLLAASGCGENRFQKEFERETAAVTLAREAKRGDYALITTAELGELIDQKTDMVLVDAMPYEDSYLKERIPGARHFLFPIPEMPEWDDQKTGGKTKEEFAELLGAEKGKPIVIYCGFVKCTRSHNGAMWARKLGYTNVRRHPGGIFAWKGAGYATESGSP